MAALKGDISFRYLKQFFLVLGVSEKSFMHFIQYICNQFLAIVEKF